ncbi:MAG: hypothetical protein M3Z65_08410, partial [Chloroflexota bacterium]|nr:hypothetical protein [Chloroflexota bacterium]
MSAIEWLLDSDPAIRWQVLRDLTDAPAGEVGAERARVATEGWGAQLLALRRADGLWETPRSDSEWPSLLALVMLRDMGLDPSSEQARTAIADVRDNAIWHSRGAWHGTPVLAG